MCQTKTCAKCNEVKDLSSFGKNNRAKNGLQNRCKKCISEQAVKNKSKRAPNVKPEEGYKICSRCSVEKHVDEFYLNSNLSMGVHSECIKCTKEKVSNWYKENPEKVKLQPCRKYKPKVKEIKVKAILFEKMCTHCEIIKPIENFSGTSSRCKICLKEYTKTISCTVELSEKPCGKCKIIKPKEDYNIDKNTRSGLSSKCSVCRKVEYEARKEYILYKKKLSHNDRYKNDKFYRLVYTIRGRIRNSLSIYLKDNEKKSQHSEDILGCSWEDFKLHIESQFLDWMNWDNFGDACGDSPDYNCSWDLDHIIPVSWAKTNNELYALNRWSNFQPLCSKINRNIKKAKVYPCTNLELRITFWEDYYEYI